MKRRVLLNAGVALAYVIGARLGFHLASSAEQISTVWPPTGLAIASLLLGGSQLWPGVWLGAFAANAGTHAPVWTAAVIASGNTLEAVAAHWSIRHLRIDPRLRTIRAVVAFAILGAGLCTMISATTGVFTLVAAHVQPWSRVGTLWFDWWLGDLVGAIVLVPPILAVRDARWSRRDVLEVLAFTIGSVVVAHLVFGDVFGRGSHPVEYFLFPVMIAAAMRGNRVPFALAIVAASTVAIWNTVRGLGPFAGPSLHHSLVMLQLFTCVLVMTTLLLAAVVYEWRETMRREAASVDALHAREEMLRLAQRAGNIGTFEWDFQAGQATCSEEFFRLFGLPFRDGRISTDEWATFMHPEDREAMAAHLQGAIQGDAPAAADYRIRTADGQTRWLSYIGQIESTPHGRRMMGVVMDVTARKADEAALKEAKAAAESSSSLKDQFLAMLSHELRTPLSAVLGYARLLQTGTLPAEMQRRAIDVIERNAQAQARLVEELLDMSRIAADRVPIDPRPMAPAAVLRDAVDAIAPSAATNRIDVRLQVADDVADILGDATRLRQVFSNLLTNAIKFTPPGGRVDVSVRNCGEHVEVVVADTGIGIAPEFLPFVFEPFRQEEAKFDASKGGLGLGLALSRKLVELHGGTIDVVSAGPGRGATFRVRLPRTFEEPQAEVTRARSV